VFELLREEVGQTKVAYKLERTLLLGDAVSPAPPVAVASTQPPSTTTAPPHALHQQNRPPRPLLQPPPPHLRRLSRLSHPQRSRRRRVSPTAPRNFCRSRYPRSCARRPMPRGRRPG
jgi:hypothetical protein